MIATMHHPWRRLRDHFPEWRAEILVLPKGLMGGTHLASRTIYLDAGLDQAERRCTLDHELEHAEAGDDGCQHRGRERQIEELSARRLIPLGNLVEAAIWAVDLAELADECWVDVDTMQCRIDTLTDDERAEVRQAIAIRDWHEEGMP
jgi:hypothetical protein